MPKTFRVVGAGRAGTALHAALASSGWRPADPRPLGRDDDVAGAARGVDLLVLAVPDGRVAEVASVVSPEPDTVVAHLAGSLGLDVLAPHERRASIHPLVALADPDSAVAALTGGAWFATSGDQVGTEVVNSLSGRVLRVDDGHRANYHAAASVAANHLTALLGQVERIAATVGLPLEPFLDLADGALASVRAVGPAAALTGPVSRGDWATVTRHLEAIGPAEAPAYEAMAEAARVLSGQRRPAPVDLTVIDTVAAFTKALEAERAAGRRVGLVPTMGFLHDGHASLIEAAARDCDVVALTIFVNPLQFAAGEDLSSYPRDLDRDLEVAKAAGASIVFVPSVEEMYPGGTETTVTVDGPSRGLEGGSRPTHFAGVATVVAKLFAMAGPCRAYFGEKDFQQLAVVRRMAADLSFPVEIIGCPIIREADGLAMSSRNVYLAADERAAATVLSRALQRAAAAIDAGGYDSDELRRLMAATISSEPLVDLDYAEIVDPATFAPLSELLVSGEVRLLLAARVGSTRLIDNLGVTLR